MTHNPYPKIRYSSFHHGIIDEPSSMTVYMSSLETNEDDKFLATILAETKAEDSSSSTPTQRKWMPNR
jgi:hypothetical protein